MKTKKSTIQRDMPAKIFQNVAAYFAEPLTDVINCAISTGKYPEIWKTKIVTPMPKSFPTLKITDVRNIRGLLNCDKIAEKLISELMIHDMKENIDPAQYGNIKLKSINHYLIKIINRILTSLDNNSRREAFAVVANLID